MKYKGQERSKNVEDRRGQKAGAGRMVRSKGGKLGIGTIIMAIIAIFVLKQDPQQVIGETLGGAQSQQQETTAPSQQTTGNQAEDDLAEFLSVVLKETEDVWNVQFPRQTGERYVEPTLVLFSDAVNTACGNATKAVGPFYCSGDNKLYIDLSFKRDLEKRFGAKGDFAMAYVVAHEVAHHIQNLLGQTRYVHSQKSRISQTEYNKLSVRLELQADFYAGIWAHYLSKETNLLERGDIDEALNAAFAIGDDNIQRMGRGSVIPESFTHGTSKQRMKWFKLGYRTGDMSQGDTFAESDRDL